MEMMDNDELLPSVVLLTFSRTCGRLNPGLFKVGYIDYDFFVREEILPENSVHVYIHEKYMKYKTRDGEQFEFQLDHWGLSRNLFDMCKPISEISYPFITEMTVDVKVGEYE